jgi:hypothetical protein
MTFFFVGVWQKRLWEDMARAGSRFILENGAIVNISGGTLNGFNQANFVVNQNAVVNVNGSAVVHFHDQSIFEVTGRASFQAQQQTLLSQNARLRGTGEMNFEMGTLHTFDQSQVYAHTKALLIFNANMNIQLRGTSSMLIEGLSTLRLNGGTVKFEGDYLSSSKNPITLRSSTSGNTSQIPTLEANAKVLFHRNAHFQIFGQPNITSTNDWLNISGTSRQKTIVELMPAAILKPHKDMKLIMDLGTIVYHNGTATDNTHILLPLKTTIFGRIDFEGATNGQHTIAMVNNGHQLHDTPEFLNVYECNFKKLDRCIWLWQPDPLNKYEDIAWGRYSRDIYITDCNFNSFNVIAIDMNIKNAVLIHGCNFTSNIKVPQYAHAEVSSKYAPAMRFKGFNLSHNKTANPFTITIDETIIQNEVEWTYYPEWFEIGFDPSYDYVNNGFEFFAPTSPEIDEYETSCLASFLGCTNVFFTGQSEVRNGFVGVVGDLYGEDDGVPIGSNITFQGCSKVHNNYVGIHMLGTQYPVQVGNSLQTVFGGIILAGTEISNNCFGIYGKNVWIDANLTGGHPNIFGLKANATHKGHYFGLAYDAFVGSYSPFNNQGQLPMPENSWEDAPILDQNYLMQKPGLYISAPNPVGGIDCDIPVELMEPDSIYANASQAARANIVVDGVEKSLLRIYLKGKQEYLNQDIETAITTMSEITEIPMELIDASTNPYVKWFHMMAWTIAPKQISIGSGDGDSRTVKKYIQTNQIKLLPNPANEYFTLTLPYGKFNITIIDGVGKIVKSVQVADSEQIAIDDFPSGMYQVKIQNVTDNSLVKVEKLMVIKK